MFWSNCWFFLLQQPLISEWFSRVLSRFTLERRFCANLFVRRLVMLTVAVCTWSSVRDLSVLLLCCWSFPVTVCRFLVDENLWRPIVSCLFVVTSSNTPFPTTFVRTALFFNVQLWIINFAHVECSAICCISAFAVCHVPSSIFFIVLQRDSFFPILSYLHLPVRFHYHQGTLSVQGCAVEALLWDSFLFHHFAMT